MRSKKALINIFTNLLLQVVVVVYGFIVPRMIIGTYGSNVNGLVSSVTQFLGYISLLQMGFGPVVHAALYKPIAKKDTKEIANILKTAETFFRNIAKVFIIYIIFLTFLYPLIINNDFGYIYTSSMVVIISISTFAEYYFGMTYSCYLQSEQKTYVISAIQIITYILSMIIIIVSIKLNMSIHMIKLLSGIIFVLRPIFLNIYVKKKYKINLENTDSNYKLKNKWDGMAQHIATVIHENTDITVLSIFSKFTEVSVYSIYYLVVTGIKKLIQVFSSDIGATFGDMIAKNEMDNLNKKFNMYEVLYNSINTILFTSTMILIVPFISIYTKGVTDVNYIRPLFGYLIVIGEYICMLRSPYLRLTHAAGHFKETQKGAWIECISNLLISLILVFKFGIIGVTIGTIVAMTIRTIEFIYHSNKYILKRSSWISLKKMILVIIETLLVILLSNYLPMIENISYVNWVVNSIMVVGLATIIVLLINFIFYKQEFLKLIAILKGIIIKTKKIQNR